MTTALLILDAQVNMFSPTPVFQGEALLGCLRELAARGRAAGVPVIFARHDGGFGAIDERGKPGWELHPELEIVAADVVLDKDTPNAFLRTSLAAELARLGATRLVVCGLQTEMCVDTTCRAAFALGYQVVLVADGHSTFDTEHLTAEQVIAHHNDILTGFVAVEPADQVSFETAAGAPALEGLQPEDEAAIRAGLEEWRLYDRWLSSGDSAPFWPHTHPALAADTLHQLWEPAFRLRERYVDPPPWEMGISRTFLEPIRSAPLFMRKAAIQSVTKAFDHLLQNPRNPLSPHISRLSDEVFSFDGRDVRLFYVPRVTTDAEGRERRYVFLLWAAPGVAPKNPFAM